MYHRNSLLVIFDEGFPPLNMIIVTKISHTYPFPKLHSPFQTWVKYNTKVFNYKYKYCGKTTNTNTNTNTDCSFVF